MPWKILSNKEDSMAPTIQSVLKMIPPFVWILASIAWDSYVYQDLFGIQAAGLSALPSLDAH